MYSSETLSNTVKYKSGGLESRTLRFRVGVGRVMKKRVA